MEQEDLPLSGVGGRGAGEPRDERRRQALAGGDPETDRPENAVQAIVDINGHGISTSGSYRNYYELDGKRISHVIDPQTGQPITHKLVSVTVIAPTALEADGWDTGLMVLGPEKAQQVVREQGLAVYMIVKEGRV
jgi:thiamine biosynthesis lipoprotein